MKENHEFKRNRIENDNRYVVSERQQWAKNLLVYSSVAIFYILFFRSFSDSMLCFLQIAACFFVVSFLRTQSRKCEATVRIHVGLQKFYIEDLLYNDDETKNQCLLGIETLSQTVRRRLGEQVKKGKVRTELPRYEILYLCELILVTFFAYAQLGITGVIASLSLLIIYIIWVLRSPLVCLWDVDSTVQGLVDTMKNQNDSHPDNEHYIDRKTLSQDLGVKDDIKTPLHS